MAEPGQVVGGRQPARPGADHEHPLAAAHRRRVEQPALLEREVAQEALDRVDRDGAVEAGAVADALARVVADPPVDRGQRVVGDELAPRLLVPAGLRVRQPGLDVLAGRAAGVARRQQVDVDGTALADRAGVGAPVQQVRQRRDVPHRILQRIAHVCGPAMARTLTCSCRRGMRVFYARRCEEMRSRSRSSADSTASRATERLRGVVPARRLATEGARRPGRAAGERGLGSVGWSARSSSSSGPVALPSRSASSARRMLRRPSARSSWRRRDRRWSWSAARPGSAGRSWPGSFHLPTGLCGWPRPPAPRSWTAAPTPA